MTPKLLAACVAAALLFATPAPANTLFDYTGYALAGGGTGGNITASVTLSCSGPCAPGKYVPVALSLSWSGNNSYGPMTLSWPSGQGNPYDPYILIDASQNVFDWNLFIVANDAISPTLLTRNTTDPLYAPNPGDPRYPYWAIDGALGAN